MATQPQIPDPRVEDLVRAGKVRVARLGGLLQGINMDLARAFAARLRIEVLPIEYPTPTAVLESLKAGACDSVTSSIPHHRPDWLSPSGFCIHGFYTQRVGSRAKSGVDLFFGETTKNGRQSVTGRPMTGG
jgi:ABC-type amino acid transport substrate-binding protein